MPESRLGLSAGDWVEVRSKEEILATLDRHGRLGQLPFMPEMFAFCGRRYQVQARAHKTCDTVNRTGGRHVEAAVHLEGLRCDGSAHDGCQALCLLFWKEAWLTRVDGPDGSRPPSQPASGRPSAGASESDVIAATRTTGTEGAPIYMCQATTLPEYTTLLPWWDMRQYIEDYTSGNVTVRRMINGAAYVCFRKFVNGVGRFSPPMASRIVGVYDRWQRAKGGVPYPRRWGAVPPGEKTPSRPLYLQPGELVQVRSYEEILATLDRNNKNRGLYFDAEEVPYCGQTFRVRSPVTRIIDERTGRMLHFNERNVILEGAICEARYSDRRMFCPRAIYPYWRETWLKRVEEPAVPTGGTTDHGRS